MPINNVPTSPVITDGQGVLAITWQAFMNSLGTWLGPVGSSGATANRPKDGNQKQLYIGQQYFDTTLGKPIWVQSKNPTVWCDATGTAA